jgi:DNA replication initiation complex subunit (GINS family)
VAPEDVVTFERVTKLYREETSRKTLTALEADFYDKLAAYIGRLEASATKEALANPNSPKAMLLQDELRKVRKKREQIFTYRERKLALLASHRASGSDVELPNLPAQERTLFESLVAVLKGGRDTAFGGSPAGPAPEAPAEPGARPPAEPSKLPVAPAAVVRVVSSEETKRPVATPSLKDYLIVHVLEDIPPFAGIDQTYHLKKEDVLTLPKTIAQILVDRGKARIVQATGSSR